MIPLSRIVHTSQTNVTLSPTFANWYLSGNDVICGSTETGSGTFGFGFFSKNYFQISVENCFLQDKQNLPCGQTSNFPDAVIGG